MANNDWYWLLSWLLVHVHDINTHTHLHTHTHTHVHVHTGTLYMLHKSVPDS